ANVAPSPIWSPPAPNWTPRVGKWGTFQNQIMFPLGNGKLGEYTFGFDPAVTHTPGEPAAFVASVTPAAQTAEGRGSFTFAAPYRGKRVRLSAWLKTEAVQQRAAVQLQ